MDVVPGVAPGARGPALLSLYTAIWLGLQLKLQKVSSVVSSLAAGNLCECALRLQIANNYICNRLLVALRKSPSVFFFLCVCFFFFLSLSLSLSFCLFVELVVRL